MNELREQILTVERFDTFNRIMTKQPLMTYCDDIALEILRSRYQIYLSAKYHSIKLMKMRFTLCFSSFDFILIFGIHSKVRFALIVISSVKI